MSYPCAGLDPFRQKAAVMSACGGCSHLTWCRQLAADHGETEGVWGGLDLSVLSQRAQLPAPQPVPQPAPVPVRRVGRPELWEGCTLDPALRSVSLARTRSKPMAD